MNARQPFVLLAAIAAACSGQAVSSMVGAASAATPSPLLQVTTPTCRTGVTSGERYAVFVGAMPMRRNAHRLAMQFTLQVRRPGETAFVAAATPPDFARWHMSKPRVRGFLFNKRVDGMEGPATYRVTVRFRWLSKSGAVLATASRRSPVCTQPDQRPDLRVGGLTVGPAGSDGMSAYRIVIANTGRSSAGPFILAVGPKEPPVTRVAVGGLLAGERRTVGVLAPPCGSGDDVVVIVDADAVVSEAVEVDNTKRLRCAR